MDAGDAKTQKETKKLEKEIHKIFTEAKQDLRNKIDKFDEETIVKTQVNLNKVASGEWTQEEYNKWQAGRAFQSKQWKAKQDQIIHTITNANTIAINMVNGAKSNVFAYNANYQAYQIENGLGLDVGFGLWDSTTVANLIENNPQVLPKWKVDEEKDYIWNKKKVNNAITQGIIQGERIDQISARLVNDLVTKNEKKMDMFARTGMTQAQNAGRYERLMESKSMGIDVIKRWVATLDGRTRDSHAALDGEEQKVGDTWHPMKFSNGCRYPGDPTAPPAEVYNCRCKLVGSLPKYEEEFERRDQELGEPIPYMSYSDWADYKKAKSGFGKAQSEVDKIQNLITSQGADKVFKGIWKNDVTYADWEEKKDSIQAKKDYYAEQIQKSQKDFYDMFDPDSDEGDDLWDAFSSYAQNPGKDELKKIKETLELYGYDDDDYLDMKKVFKSCNDKIQHNIEYLNELFEFEKHGEEYSALFKQLNEAKQKVKDLTPKPLPGSIFGKDAYSQTRKDAAFWAKSKEEADKKFRSATGDVWKNATTMEKHAAWDYTAGSGKFNRPLRGYRGSWSNFVGIGGVPLNYEYGGNEIKELTKLIEKSTLQQDTWLQRGVDNSGLAGFLNIDRNLLSGSQSDLETLLIGKEISDAAFMSCGSSKGSGFGGNILNIYCPKGTQAIYCEPFSEFGYGGEDWDGVSTSSHLGSELETLLQRNTRFRVTKVEKKFGNTYIDIEVVGQDPHRLDNMYKMD